MACQPVIPSLGKICPTTENLVDCSCGRVPPQAQVLRQIRTGMKNKNKHKNWGSRPCLYCSLSLYRRVRCLSDRLISKCSPGMGWPVFVTSLSLVVWNSKDFDAGKMARFTSRQFALTHQPPRWPPTRVILGGARGRWYKSSLNRALL